MHYVCSSLVQRRAVVHSTTLKSELQALQHITKVSIISKMDQLGYILEYQLIH